MREAKALVPKLRFPEFREVPGWVQTPLRDAFKIITNGQANAQDHQDDAAYPLFDRSEVVKRSPTFLFDAEAVILPGEGMSFKPRYFNGKFNLHQRAYALMKPTLNPLFAFHSLDRFKGALADSAVKSTVLSLRMPIIEKFTIPCPTSSNEQKEVAECLGSLDELIVAEGRKLEALRQHKQGLMQQIFPQPGETVPRLRFPEFEGAPEWKIQRLDDVSPAIFDGTHQTPKYTDEGVPFYSVENLISGVANKFISREDHRKATRKNKPEKGDILLTRIGKVGQSQAVTWDHEFSVYVTLAVIKACSSFHTNYLASYFQSGCFQAELLRKSLPNAVPPKINMDDLRSTFVLLPDMAEQQRIADFLGSLGDLIAAWGRKLEVLQQHKKGLMQQLFPVLESH